MRERLKKKNNFIIGSLLAIVVVMAVGYAAFATNLNITSTSSITSTWDVKITNITTKNIVGSATSQSATYTDLTANFAANLVAPGDSITYDITVTNNGTLDAKLESITPTISNSEYITIEYLGLAAGDKLYVGQSKKLSVIVTFNDTNIETLTTTNTANISITLNYGQSSTQIENKAITLNYNTYGGNEIESDSTNLRSSVVLPTPIRHGYNFNGWYTEINGFGEKITDGDYVLKVFEAQDKTDEDSEVTIYAYWKQKKYTVKFNSQGGSGLGDKKNQTYTSSNVTLSKTPTRSGYKFEGWNVEADGSGVYIENSTRLSVAIEYLIENYNNGEDLPDQSEITLYAIWSIYEFTIHYDSDGGSAVADRTVNWDTTNLNSPTTTKNGYSFDGWYTEGGTLITDATAYRNLVSSYSTKEITLVAHWTQN